MDPGLLASTPLHFPPCPQSHSKRLCPVPRTNKGTDPFSPSGRLFGYRGSFEVEWRTLPGGAVPDHILPRRQERRE